MRHATYTRTLRGGVTSVDNQDQMRARLTPQRVIDTWIVAPVLASDKRPSPLIPTCMFAASPPRCDVKHLIHLTYSAHSHERQWRHHLEPLY